MQNNVHGNSATATSAEECTGNSATATKLATARKISLSGAVSGNANFDGSGNVIISTIQSNIAKISCTASSSATGSINYPSGFNLTNSIIISSYAKASNGRKDYNGFSVTQGSTIIIMPSESYPNSTTFEVVLMKIS